MTCTLCNDTGRFLSSGKKVWYQCHRCRGVKVPSPVPKLSLRRFLFRRKTTLHSSGGRVLQPRYELRQSYLFLGITVKTVVRDTFYDGDVAFTTCAQCIADETGIPLFTDP